MRSMTMLVLLACCSTVPVLVAGQSSAVVTPRKEMVKTVAAKNDVSSSYHIGDNATSIGGNETRKLRRDDEYNTQDIGHITPRKEMMGTTTVAAAINDDVSLYHIQDITSNGDNETRKLHLHAENNTQDIGHITPGDKAPLVKKSEPAAATTANATTAVDVFKLYSQTQCNSKRSLIGGKRVKAESWEACEALCVARPGCKAWTWNSRRWSRLCRLLRSCVTRKFNRALYSGVKAEKNQPPGQYIRYPAMKCDDGNIGFEYTATEKDCGEICDGVLECKAWTFRRRDNRCFWKETCDEREDADGNYVSGISTYHDPESGGVGALKCSPEPEPCTVDNGGLREPSAGVGGKKFSCPTWTQTKGESADPEPGTFAPPYLDIINGTRAFNTTFEDREDYPTCRFLPPQDPLPPDWAGMCIDNMRKVGFLEEVKARPNRKCPAGWFLCKGMCYTLVQRNSRGPECHHDYKKNGTDSRPSYYAPDYMGVEARCGTCGGARVAFVGEDAAMQRVAAEAARQTLNEDKAVWVRRHRFLKAPSDLSEGRTAPYQPWHRFVTMVHEDAEGMTYQRYYTGEKDGLKTPQYDARYRNQEASILCVNTLDRVAAAARTIRGMITMEEGCHGEDRHDMWDNDKHRWFPEHNWPFPGL